MYVHIYDRMGETTELERALARQEHLAMTAATEEARWMHACLARLMRQAREGAGPKKQLELIPRKINKRNS